MGPFAFLRCLVFALSSFHLVQFQFQLCCRVCGFPINPVVQLKLNNAKTRQCEHLTARKREWPQTATIFWQARYIYIVQKVFTCVHAMCTLYVYKNTFYFCKNVHSRSNLYSIVTFTQSQTTTIFRSWNSKLISSPL